MSGIAELSAKRRRGRVIRWVLLLAMLGAGAGLLAVVSWMAAMTKLDLSHAYPFMSLAFVLVLVLSALVFHEPVNAWKIGGLALITLGIIVGSQG